MIKDLFFGTIKTACVAALLLSPYVIDWVLDGCPSQEEQVERLKSEVEWGWR